jgi:hypothetical protein
MALRVQSVDMGYTIYRLYRVGFHFVKIPSDGHRRPNKLRAKRLCQFLVKVQRTGNWPNIQRARGLQGTATCSVPTSYSNVVATLSVFHSAMVSDRNRKKLKRSVRLV